MPVKNILELNISSFLDPNIAEFYSNKDSDSDAPKRPLSVIQFFGPRERTKKRPNELPWGMYIGSKRLSTHHAVNAQKEVRNNCLLTDTIFSAAQIRIMYYPQVHWYQLSPLR